MFLDYQSLVMQHYKKKRDDNDLSQGFTQLSPAKLKTECLAAFANTSSKKDRKIFIDFFEESGDDEAALKRIKKRDASVFKPLLNYLKEITNGTDPKNIELLAWLTGFEERPFEFGKRYELKVFQTDGTTPEAVRDITENKKEKEEKIEQIEKNKVTENEVVEEPQQVPAHVIPDRPTAQNYNPEKKTPSFSLTLNAFKQRTNKKMLIATLGIAALAVLGIIYKKDGLKNLMGGTLNTGEGCMYWAGNHYQQVPCNQKMGIDTFVIALDIEKLNSLKKITRPDTITSNCIGRVWYIKLNNKVEFYTASGNYPLNPTLRLKPITDHIISTYIDAGREDISH